MSSLREMERMDVVETQRNTIMDLQRKNGQLEKKIQLAKVQLSAARKNKPLLFQHVGARVDSGLKQRPKSANRQIGQRLPPQLSTQRVETSEDSSCIPSPESVHPAHPALPERVHKILEEARERILALEAERQDLQDSLADAQQTYEDTEYEMQQKITVLEEEMASLREELHFRGVREERDSVAVVRAQRENRSLAARTTALQEQVSVTEEKVGAQKSKVMALQNELERMTEKLLTSENQFREIQQEHKKLKGELQQTKEKNNIMKNENEQLQRENDRLTTFSMSLEKQQDGSAQIEIETLMAQIKHLESALQSHLSERASFLEDRSRDKEELNVAENELQELRANNFNLKEELEKAMQKLNVFSKAGLLDMTKDELASVLSKPKQDNPSEILAKETEILRKGYSELQLLYRERTMELDKTSKTIASHADTYEALETQVLELTREKEEREREMSSTIQSLKETIKRRDDRVEKLGQQMFLLTDKNLKNKTEIYNSDHAQTVKLGKHDNLLEFHIDRVIFEGSDFSKLKTFVSWTVPFSLEDPLQHTNVGIGTNAHYNHSSLYKLQMNFKNLESLRDDIVTVNVYILLDSGHPVKIGECQITFCEVLEHPRNTLHGTIPVMMAHDEAEEAQQLPPQLQVHAGQVIGTMSYWFRLQRPCEAVINQHLRNVGILAAAHHGEDQIPKLASTAVKSANPVAAKRQSKMLEKSHSHQTSSAVDKEPHKVESHVADKVTDKELQPSPYRSSYTKQNVQRDNNSELLIGNGHDSSHSTPKTEKSKSVRIQKSSKEKKSSDRDSGSSSPGSAGTYSIKSPLRKEVKSMSEENYHSDDVSIHSPQTSKAEGLFKSSQSSDEGRAISTKIIRPKSAGPGRSRKSSLPKSSETSDSSNVVEESQRSSLRKANKQKNSHRETSSVSRSQETDSPSSLSSDSEDVVEVLPHLAQIPSLRRVSEVRDNGEAHRSQETGSPSPLSSDSEDAVEVLPQSTQDSLSKIYVEVCSLILDEDTLQDPSIEFLFVDYHGFLNLPPDQLETPQSLPRPPPGCWLNFNFGQEFIVDGRKYPARKEALIELMKNRGIIKFTVTSEPPEDLQDTQECQDLGYAYVNLHDMLEKRKDLVEEDLDIERADDGSKMGTLRITLVALEALTSL